MRTGSSRIDPVAREGQALAFLDELPRELGAILIGGYAISAYGPPRHSVDLDLVLPLTSRPKVVSWSKETGTAYRQSLKLVHSGSEWFKARISRDLVSGDFYFGGLRSRPTGADVDYKWMATKPRVERLTLSTGITHLPTPVARPEVIWVLKLLAGRPQDITDLFAISSTEVDRSEVRAELLRLLDGPTRTHFRQIAARMSGDKEYRDALSRRALGPPSDPRNQRLWSTFKKLVLECLPP